jgi:hypothetical protein
MTTGGLWFQGELYGGREPHTKSPPNDADPPEGFGRVSVQFRAGQAGAFSSSAATFLVRFGSTGTPGPMVVETVTLRM